MEDFMCAAVTVIFRLCKPARLLYLREFTICKWSVNLITNPNPVYSHIVTCSPVSGKRFGKHVSAQIRFLDTDHRWVLNKRVHGYANGSCRLLETSSLLWNQQACPWIRAFNKQFTRMPLLYISGRWDKNGKFVSEKSFVNNSEPSQSQ
jgi:hypothetical protein